jgi:CDP-glucose 4,6-dehydratase
VGLGPRSLGDLGADVTPAFQGAFRGRRVLLTGHTGFKGAWLSAWLLELGAEVTGFSQPPPTDPSLFEQAELATRLRHVEGDVRDLEALAATVAASAPDVLFHLAAQALVRPSYASPRETFEVNVMGTVNVLEAVRRGGRPCAVVAVTSDKAYEDSGSAAAHREEDPLGGADPYSASKGAAELVVASYRRSFFPPQAFERHGVALASARAGNVIGGGDWAEHRIVPDIVRAVLRGDPVRLRHPEAVRPWQHVLDALSGYLWLAARMLGDGADGLAEPWNFGPEPGTGLDVETLTERILRAFGGGTWHASGEEGGPREAPHLALSIDKASARLPWRPTWDVGRAVDETVAWYRERASDPWERTREQIGRYTEDAKAAGQAWAGSARVA